MDENIRIKIPSLTGIRGIAAVIVLLFHLPLAETFKLTNGVIFIRNGYYGVDLFFILSGFILFHVHGKEFVSSITSAIKSFAVARFLRVYPLHLVVLLVILGFVLLVPKFADWFRTLPGQGDAYSFYGFIQTLTLTNGIGGLPNFGQWNGPSWSLSAELVGYATFPILAYFVNRLATLRHCYCVAAAALGLYSVMRSGMLGFEVGLLRMEFCFVSGVALARAYHLRPKIASSAFVAQCSAVLSIALLSMDTYAYLSVIAFALLIYSLALGGGGVERFMGSRPIVFLGEISFSLYMSHFVLQAALLWAFWSGTGSSETPIFTTAVLVGFSIFVGLAFYSIVERPSHRIGRSVAIWVKEYDKSRALGTVVKGGEKAGY